MISTGVNMGKLRGKDSLALAASENGLKTMSY
jgi:hypothetical protein